MVSRVHDGIYLLHSHPLTHIVFPLFVLMMPLNIIQQRDRSHQLGNINGTKLIPKSIGYESGDYMPNLM